MTIFSSVDEASKFDCPLFGKKGEGCIGTKCAHYMLRQYKEEGQNRTDPGNGVCGWVYMMAYFRDKNENKTL